jgi:hypothetical protein
MMESSHQEDAHPENPAQWPEELLAVFERSVTCAYASLTGKGQPITYPVNPYVNEDRRMLEVTTGLTYPAKADRARRNPKVALLFADRAGVGAGKRAHRRSASQHRPLCACLNSQAAGGQRRKFAATGQEPGMVFRAHLDSGDAAGDLLVAARSS